MTGRKYLSTILNNSLVGARPELAVTLVENHDTQPLQSLEAPVEAWFKPLAYAIILLRESGYPCIFYPDLYGAQYTDKGKDGQDYTIRLDKVESLEQLLQARARHAGQVFTDYLQKHPAEVTVGEDGWGNFMHVPARCRYG